MTHVLPPKKKIVNKWNITRDKIIKMDWLRTHCVIKALCQALGWNQWVKVNIFVIIYKEKDNKTLMFKLKIWNYSLELFNVNLLNVWLNCRTKLNVGPKVFNVISSMIHFYLCSRFLASTIYFWLQSKILILTYESSFCYGSWLF